MRFANRTGVRVAIATAATGALAAGAFAVMTSASASPNHAAEMHGVMGVHAVSGPTAYSFRTVDNNADLTFNQLLGINDAGVIAGYFGSGAQGHPNMGYLLVRTVTGVTTPVPATGWYLNLHQGTSNNILANGQPTPNFRPLLCAGF